MYRSKPIHDKIWEEDITPYDISIILNGGATTGSINELNEEIYGREGEEDNDTD